MDIHVSRRSALGGLVGGAAVCAWPRSIAAAPPSLSLAQVIARHTRARGGAERLDCVRAVSIYPTITEKGSVLRAHYLCTDAPAWRIDIYADAHHVFSEGLDAAGPWLWPAGDAKPHDAVADARKTGIQGIEFNLYGLHRFPSRGHSLFLEGREAIGGTNYYVVRVHMKDSYETHLYINPRSWMIERRRDFRAFHPDVDPTKVYAEKVYSDFRTVDGIVSPFSEVQRNWKNGQVINTTITDSMTYNPAIEPGELERSYKAPDALS
jgi:hypothetical protein